MIEEIILLNTHSQLPGENCPSCGSIDMEWVDRYPSDDQLRPVFPRCIKCGSRGVATSFKSFHFVFGGDREWAHS